jgi:hypothetical protein
LRDYLTKLAMEEVEREHQNAIEENLLDPEDSPGADTMSDDGTIDGNDHSMDVIYGPGRYGRPSVSNTRPRPRPRSLQNLSSNHVEMPLLDPEQMQRMGPWTPNGPSTPEIRAQLAPAHLNLISSSNSRFDLEIDYARTRSPAPQPMFDVDYQDLIRSRSQTRRHTLESTPNYFPPPSPGFNPYAIAPNRGSEDLDDRRRLSATTTVLPSITRNASNSWSRNLVGRRADSAAVQTFLRPDPDYSAFDANHDSIMSTIPGSRGHSRSNSPHMSRVSSRSRMNNLLNNMRTLSSSPLLQPESSGPSRRNNRSREASASRPRSEAHREAVLRAMMAADAADQLRPDLPPAMDRQMELPLLPPGLLEQVPLSPVTPSDTPHDRSPAIRPIDASNNGNQDVNMTQ